MPWYAIQHKPGQGNRALENLQNQQATCFYPKIQVEKVQGGKRIRKTEPLFPGYLFIRIDASNPLWGKLRSTRGVLRVVGFANRPAAIDDEVISQIKESLDAVSEQGGIRPGQTVEIQEGPFKGLSAVFEKYQGDERAIVLIEFLNRKHTVKIGSGSFRLP
ncbi:transcription/translation regulatory transformer protein RfaH [Marinobacter salicampi]|uniref:transcription/translation regulatory transformer protein RfaH n=1 Tax=Marinobacter salicampi TaxID=435907 RepID=UPI00140B5DF8|nr:transcription/translation regulatory transformer protein RfaH [Marinobacter salicampi]